jgi:hypothetical protein
LIAIYANRGTKDTIAHAQHSLRAGEAAALAIYRESGSFEGADVAGLPAEGLRLVGPDEPSSGLDELSVLATSDGWAAAVQARPGACFYLRLEADATFYGAGTECTGRMAVQASDSRW